MRILTWPTEKILQEVKQLEKEIKQFKLELTKICWYMRGSVSLEEVYFMSPEDREICATLISENIETTKKSGLPFF
jgi:hypothetical protein